MPDKDGINKFRDGSQHCAHCDVHLAGPEDELWHRHNHGPLFRAGVASIERGKGYEKGVESALRRPPEVPADE
jgi:hypothetical protein